MQLNQITTVKKGLAIELRQIIDAVKGLDYNHKSVSNQLTQISNTYDEKMKDLTGSGH